MARQPMAEELLDQIPGWLYAELSDEQISKKLGCSPNWAVIVIERYVKKRGHHSRIQLVMEYVDALAEEQPEHPDFIDAATRVARLTEQEAKVLNALLRSCWQPATPTMPAAEALTGVKVGFMCKHLLRARSPEALDHKGHWHMLVKLYYMNFKYQEHLLIKWLTRPRSV